MLRASIEAVLVWLLATVVGFSLALIVQTPAAFLLGVTIGLSGGAVSGLMFLRALSSGDEVQQQDLDRLASSPHLWAGTETGSVRFVPGDLLWIPALCLAFASTNQGLVQAVNAGAPPVVLLSWPLVVVGVGLLFRRRHRLLVRRPVRVVLRADDVVVAEEHADRTTTEVSMAPHHVLLRHRDGTVTVAFGEVATLGRALLRSIAGSPVDLTWVRRRVPNLSLLLVRVAPGESFVRALGRPEGSDGW